jgi:hypothetical protein
LKLNNIFITLKGTEVPSQSVIFCYFLNRKNEYPKKPPKFYEVTNNSKERPDVWIESPDK